MFTADSWPLVVGFEVEGITVGNVEGVADGEKVE